MAENNKNMRKRSDHVCPMCGINYGRAQIAFKAHLGLIHSEPAMRCCFRKCQSIYSPKGVPKLKEHFLKKHQTEEHEKVC